MNIPLTSIAMSFDLWQRAGCPVGPLRNLKRVWPTSPYVKLAGEKAPPAIRAVKKGKR